MASNAQELVRRTYIQWAADLYAEQQEEYLKYDDYYNGDHPLAFSTERWKSSFGTTFEEFSDNWCQVVPDALAQRIEILGWRCTQRKLARLAEEIWDRNNCGEEEEDLTLQTLIKGDGYLMVWPDPMESETFAQIFFNDALDINVEYDPANKRRIIRASKKWVTEEGYVRLNIYHPDRIVQYIADNERYVDENYELDPIDIPPDGWRVFDSIIANPYGRVPVFHFKNRPSGSTHGMSEIKTVIPQQNAVNKILMDMLLGSEFSGFPQKWMAGGGHPKDGWRAGAERVWATTDPNAKFGQFDAMDLDPARNFVEMMVAHIAKTTQTPMHYLRASGDMPSGEALKTAESGLVHKAKNRQKRWGYMWSEVMRFAIQIETGEPLDKNIDLEPVWKFAETRYDLEQAQTAQLKSILGVPLEQLWSEHFGYTEEQIEKFKKENREIAAAALAQIISQQAQIPGQAELTLADMLGVEDITSLAGMNISQILAQLSKSQTGATTAGEATTRPQPNTRPPASPTRRSSGFRD